MISDEKFVTMLNDLRIGKITFETRTILQGLDRVIHYQDGIEPTHLYPTRKQVDTRNREKLASLDGNVQNYESDDNAINEFELKKINENTIANQKLELKLGI